MSLAAHGAAFAAPIEIEGKRTLIGLSHGELVEALQAEGLEAFRARQVWHWLYYRGVTDFTAMGTLAKPAREKLAELFSIRRPGVSRHQTSSDGTQKFLLRMADGQEVETVHIPETERGTLCVSSQVGCTLTCRFCHTGTQPLVRNLGPGEIVSQILHARDELGEWPKPGEKQRMGEDRSLTNIVMMGMGEPLYNYENVAKALRIVMDGDGIAISKRRITLSTSGVVPMIRQCGVELGVNLAVSLHATNDELRDHLMPINRKYPIAELLDACRTYPGVTNSRRITFEYVMLKGINDSMAEARALVALLRDVPSKVNLIPFNPWPGSEYEVSSAKTIEAFAEILSRAGFPTPIRRPRGEDILAACGQLKSDSERKRRTVSGQIIIEGQPATGMS